MRHADEALLDEGLLEIIQEDLNKRCKKSRTPRTPLHTGPRSFRCCCSNICAAGVTRMRRVKCAPTIGYREFTGVGGKVPDDKTMGRLARQSGPRGNRAAASATVGIAREKQVVAGRRMRVDTTVVETISTIRPIAR
jgi:IS5 family transposase